MTKLPPVPQQNRSPKRPGEDPRPEADVPGKPKRENLREQGRQGNMSQNTTNQGYSRTADMPKKHPNTARIGGPGASHENRQEPDKSKARGQKPADTKPSFHSGVSGG